MSQFAGITLPNSLHCTTKPLCLVYACQVLLTQIIHSTNYVGQPSMDARESHSYGLRVTFALGWHQWSTKGIQSIRDMKHLISSDQLPFISVGCLARSYSQRRLIVCGDRLIDKDALSLANEERIGCVMPLVYCNIKCHNMFSRVY